MRGKEMLIPCDHCEHPGWCQEHGCTTWNDESRRLFDGYRKIHEDALRKSPFGRARS